MRAIDEKIAQVASTEAPVLIWGESGTGKDFVARRIHAASPRRAQSFIKVSCGVTHRERLESELFGHEKGAFPGASRRKLGMFEFADKGTIFLDDVGELPEPLRSKVLQVLKHRRVCRIGGRETIPVDVRVIASASETPEASAGGATLWKALRGLKVVEIHLPSLRERKEDIPVLASLFLARFSRQYHRNVQLSPDTVALFQEYTWPGNIRELENMVRRLVVTGDPLKIHVEIRSRLRP